MNDALRAEAIFYTLREVREYCKRYPEYNVAININGMNGCVDVKVFRDNQCVQNYLDPDGALHEMLSNTVAYLDAECGPLGYRPVELKSPTRDAHVNWNNYATCARCGSVMGAPCVRLDMPDQQMAKPHVGRIRFRGDRRAEERSAAPRDL
jgi:hypothetical protein